MSILSRVQSNPQIGTENSAFVSELIERCKSYVKSYCNLTAFPELSRGTYVSGSTPSTNISTITSNEILVGVNGSSMVAISLDLTVCTSGNAIATELQSKINAVGLDHGFDEVTVSYANSLYTISSGRYGDSSKIRITFNDQYKHLAQSLKLSVAYGGTFYDGASDIPALQDACVMLVEMKYRQLGLEGLQSGSIPGGVSFSLNDLDPTVKLLLARYRRF